jgi:hypothetical protein
VTRHAARAAGSAPAMDAAATEPAAAAAAFAAAALDTPAPPA